MALSFDIPDKISQILTGYGHFKRVAAIYLVGKVKKSICDPTIHLFLGQADKLFKIEYGHKADSPDKFISKVRITRESFV